MLQRGIALVSSLLLLIIITILALSMFRSFGAQEKIAGNLREKERALHAAESAQQFGEWWLLQGNNAAIGAVTCVPGLNARLNQGQICNLSPVQAGFDVTSVPWPASAASVSYLPPGMSITPGLNVANPPYFDTPAFYIADLGPAADNTGEAYQIDAYGYGGSAATVAVVESTYEIQQGVVNRGGL
jgi:type IV pilus assembly protein PilX